MFRGVSGAIPVLAAAMAVCAPAHAGPIWSAWDAAAAEPRPLYLAATAAPGAGLPPPEAVREAQELLAALGYRPGPADGVWGGRTAGAFRAFLRDAGFPAADGLTPDMLRALRRLAAGPYGAAGGPPAPAPEPTAPGPSCEDAAEGAKCWKEVSSRPGCYVWDNGPAKSQTVSWSGECRGDKVEGRGILIRYGVSIAEIRYEGEWREGKLQGHGTRTTSRGDRYEGGWRDGEKHGQGTWIWPDGQRYAGNWRNDERNGQGTHAWPDGQRYEGNWSGDKRNGRGTFTWPDGRRYAGNWSDGKINGQGTRTWPDGRRYAGNWRDGKRNGRGTFTWPDGRRYEGEWRNGQRNGRGTFTWPDGQRYAGNWRDGKINGEGTRTWPDGRRYAGNWRDGKPQGWGAFAGADGNDYAGEWSRGCYEKDGARAAVMTTGEDCGF